MVITNTLVSLAGVLPVNGSNITDAIGMFWALPLVGALLMLCVTLAMGPRIFRVIRGLFGMDGTVVAPNGKRYRWR